MPGRKLRLIFKAKARKAKELSDLWRKALNEWLDLSEHEKDLDRIMRFGKREWLARKKANKATEDMYVAWKNWKGL